MDFHSSNSPRRTHFPISQASGKRMSGKYVPESDPAVGLPILAVCVCDRTKQKYAELDNSKMIVVAREPAMGPTST